MRSLLIAFALILVSTSTALSAPQINDEGAQQLKASFQNIIDYLDAVYGAEGLGGPEPLMRFDGELTVKPQGTHYDVIWPHLYYQEPFGAKVDLGVMSFNVTPSEKEGYWNMVMALPTSYSITDEEGKQIKINIGAQNAVGLFHEKMGWFTKLDANYENITISGAEDTLEDFKIDNVKVSSNLEEDAEGRLSGPAMIGFNNVIITPKEDDVTIKIGTLALDYSLHKLTPPSLSEYKEKFIKHADTLQALNSPDADEHIATGTVDGKAVMDMFADLYGFNVDGFDFRYYLENLDVSSTNPDDEDFDRFSVDKGHFSIGINGMESDNEGSLSLGLAYSGAMLAPAQPEYDGIMPQDANINIRAEKIPVQSISALGKNTMTAITQNPEMAQMAGLALAMKLPAILSQAGTEIIVEDNHVNAGLYNASLNGKLIADINAVSSAVGKFKGLFEGLDALHALASKNAEKADSENAKSFADLLNTLNLLKAFGTPATGPNGKPAYAYDLELTSQGQFLINGQAMGGAIGNGQASPAPQAEEPAAGETAIR